MTEHDDEISGSADIKSFDVATRAVRRFGQTQEYMDALFDPEMSDVPIHSADEDNGSGFQKLFGCTSKPLATTTPVRKVAPKVELRDPLGGFDNAGLSKMLKASRPAADDLRHNPDFPKALAMVTKFSNRVSRRRVHGEEVRTAQANVIVSILEHLEQTREDARAGL